MILQQNDGVFPNATNATGTVSVTSPSGTSVISVNIAQGGDQMVADQVKRANHAGNFIDNDEILPGYGKEKRQHNVCYLTCTPARMADICEGSPVFASCADDCTLVVVPPIANPSGIIVGPLDGSDDEPHPDGYSLQAACLDQCTCSGRHDEQVVDDDSNGDNPFQGLD